MAITRVWEHSVKFPWGGHYPAEVYFLAFPILILIWLVSIYYSGGYDKPIHFWRSFRGLLSGTIIILVIYALLPEHFRFSRTLILSGTLWGLVSLTLSRIMFGLLKVPGYSLKGSHEKRFAIIGESPETQRVADLLKKALPDPAFIGLVHTHANNKDSDGYLGHLGQIKDIISIYSLNELIFCAKDLPAENIIDQMSALQQTQVNYKIAPPESLSIIGSNSIDTAGDLYVIDINSIGKFQNRRSKRLFDLSMGIALFVLSPVLVWFAGNPVRYFANVVKTIAGYRSLIGYHPLPESEHKLPVIQHGIIYPSDAITMVNPDNQTIERLNILYARDYKVANDFRLLFSGFRYIGRR
jgi:hypothetical protein